MRKSLLSLLLLLVVSVDVGTVHGREYLCYLHGAQGLSDYFVEIVAPQLVERKIPLVAFDMGKEDPVEQRAETFSRGMEELLHFDPTAQCHVLGYSMGGVVARYALHHVALSGDFGSSESFQDRVLSLTTVSSPHRGTPLANLLRDHYPGMMPALEGLGEDGMLRFNTPGSPEYSPVIDALPTYYYETFVLSKEELPQITSKIGFEYLQKFLSQRGDDPTNDGIVPSASMRFGESVSSLRVSHYFFSHDTPGDTDAVGFLVNYWNGIRRLSRPRSQRVLLPHLALPVHLIPND